MSDIKTEVNSFNHSYELIKKLYEFSFNKKIENINIHKLSGGLKNAVYLIEENENKVVLKIAQKDESKMIEVDKLTFWWEAKMLKFFENIKIPTPQLLYYDGSKMLCDSEYIFMSYIEGETLLSCRKNLSFEEISKIENEIGMFCSIICSNKSNSFFLPRDPNHHFSNNFEFVLYLYENLINDVVKLNIKFDNLSIEDIYKEILFKKDSINNITNLCLNHTDIWDGNILIKNGSISGIIDFSDLYYCDELFTFYFHTIDGKINGNFLKGFNKTNFTNDENVRIQIYRAYVLLKMIVDCELKNYGKHNWIYDDFESSIQKIRKL